MKLHTISVNNLRRRKAKMLFLALGLIVAVSTVVTLISVSASVKADFGKKLDEFGANILIVPKADDLSLSYGGISISGVPLDVKNLYDGDAAKILTIKNRKNISIIAPKLLQSVRFEDRNALVVGVDFQEELRLKKWWSVIGRSPETDDEAMIGSKAKESLGAHLNKTIEIQGERFRVVGVLEPTGSPDDDIVFIDLKRAQALFGKSNQLSLIEVAALCYDCPIEEIVRQTSERLPDARVMAIRQTIEAKMEAVDSFNQFSAGISVIVLFVGALIVFTSVSSSVNERTREIGIFRAVGFRQSHIMRVILVEVLLTSSLAGLVGYFLGIGASLLISPMLSSNGGGEITPMYHLLIVSLVLAVSVGLVSSLYPAYRASRLDPTVALRAL